MLVVSAASEEYLETIYNMAMEGEPVIAARLADKLGVSRPTVSEMLKRLTSDGYVAQTADRAIQLTPEGQELTEHVLRRHRLAERLLFDVLGMDWISAHEQAHALEHWISPEVECRISTLLGHPQTCPHGNPIPGNATSGQAFLRERGAFRLSEAPAGAAVLVVLISELVEDESAVLRMVGEAGIHPRARLAVLPADEPAMVRVSIREQEHRVPVELASKIWVAAE